MRLLREFYIEKMDESQAEEALREWAASEKITAKTVDLVIKEGFNSMEALVLVDQEDLLQAKIPWGQQKLLLKALLLMQPVETSCVVATLTDGETMAAAAATTCADDMRLPRALAKGWDRGRRATRTRPDDRTRARYAIGTGVDKKRQRQRTERR